MLEFKILFLVISIWSFIMSFIRLCLRQWCGGYGTTWRATLRSLTACSSMCVCHFWVRISCMTALRSSRWSWSLRTVAVCWMKPKLTICCRIGGTNSGPPAHDLARPRVSHLMCECVLCMYVCVCMYLMRAYFWPLIWTYKIDNSRSYLYFWIFFQTCKNLYQNWCKVCVCMNIL